MASAHNPIVSAVLLRSSVVKKNSLGVRSPIRLADHLQLKNFPRLARQRKVAFSSRPQRKGNRRFVGQFAEVTDTESKSRLILQKGRQPT